MSQLLAQHAFLRFCLTGGVATAIQYVVMIALVQLAGIHPTQASSIGFCLSAVFNYLVTRRFVFASDRVHRVAAMRYLAMVSSGLLLNALCMAALQSLGLHYLPSQVLTTLIVLIYNYLIASRWVFGRGTEDVKT